MEPGSHPREQACLKDTHQYPSNWGRGGGVMGSFLGLLEGPTTSPLLTAKAAWSGTPQAHPCPCMWVTGSLTVLHLWGPGPSLGVTLAKHCPREGTEAQPHRQLEVGRPSGPVAGGPFP